MSQNGTNGTGTASTVRVALIGLGGSVDHIIMPAIAGLPNVHVVAGCDPSEEARRRVTKQWRVPTTYANAEEMLTKEQPDVAVVATPPLTHPDLCLLALEHGCHVFCEKPFMPSVEEADRVIAFARERGRIVGVNNQYYQMPIYRQTDRLLKSGEVGRLYHIHLWQQMYQIPDDEGGWKAALQPRRVLYEFGTHAIDLICHFFQAYPEAVSARIPHVKEGVNADVFVALRLDFPDDRVANVVLNRVSHAPTKYIEMRLDCDEASLRSSLGGVARLEFGWNSATGRPRVRFSLTRGGELRRERDGRSQLLVRQPSGRFHQATAAHFSDFLSAIRRGVEPPVSAEHA
ncbi:MAG: Gfo/Idh/MocA family oxidoreductase, partial [Chloroflexi bacterium]|nr:Gfo/Idh/MocA family oxidoreductase [Chloroflexota bacterium]